MNRHDVTVLDCTFRDGGYYTNWEFEPSLAAAYLAACAGVGIDVVELGYTRFGEHHCGPFGNIPVGLPSDLASALPAGHGMRFAVMLDATDMAGTADPGRALRGKLVGCPLPVSLVRVAVRYTGAASTAGALESLRSAGFDVALNLMQIDVAAPGELSPVVTEVSRLGPLAALYLADSFGSLHPARTADLIRRFAGEQPAPVGFHAHDNQGLALHNVAVAAEAGATWLDATVLGMGRGAGNARTEQLLGLLETEPARLQPLLELTARSFAPLMDKYRWGPSGLYGIAGIRRVHPSYVQRMEELTGLSADEKLRALAVLAEMPSTKYSTQTLETALSHAYA